jgi:hypothetical protein
MMMIAALPLMMMRLKITELSIGRGRALVTLMMIVLMMMSRRLRRMRRFLHFSSHLREDSQHKALTSVCLRHTLLRYPHMLQESIIVVRV